MGDPYNVYAEILSLYLQYLLSEGQTCKGYIYYWERDALDLKYNLGLKPVMRIRGFKNKK